jgi:histidinol-phosphate aminotransferase
LYKIQEAEGRTPDKTLSSYAIVNAAAMNVESLIQPHVREMKPYAPIAPLDVLSKRLGIAVDQIVKLDANENPYGPSPRVIDALARADQLYIYPDPDQNELREAISEFIGVDKEHILCGAGGDEVIELIGKAFLRSGDILVDLPPTFGMYRWLSDTLNATYIVVPRRKDFSIDIEAVEKLFDGQRMAKLLFITNPNNPDGSLVSARDLERLLALPVVVVIDEAYIEFSGADSFASRIARHDNLIVLRTFSKIAALAGMRVGYGVFPSNIVKHLWKIKQPYTPSAASSLAAIAAMRDRAYLDDCLRRLIAERSRLGELLSEFDWLSVFPSQANFLLCRVDENKNALQIKLKLESRGILVRYFDRDGLRDCVRISVGKPEQTDKLISALRDFGRMR